MLADQWIGGQKSGLQRRTPRKKERKGGTAGEEDRGNKEKKHFFLEVREESVKFDYLLLYLILFFRITVRFLLIFRWVFWLPKEVNLFQTFVYLIFVFSRMSCMSDIFCVCVLSSLRSSHQALLKALLVFVMQSLVLVVLSPLIHCSVLLLFLFFFFFSIFPLYSWHFLERRFVSLRVKQSSKLPGYILQSEQGKSLSVRSSLTCPSKGFMFPWWITQLPHAYAFFTVRVSHTYFLTQACRNQASSTTPIFLSFILHPTPSLTWRLTGACYPSLLHILIKSTHPSLHIHTTHTHPSCYS